MPRSIPLRMPLPGACLLLALAACASQTRIADADVRMTDRVECRHQRGVAADARADPARDSGPWGAGRSDCQDPAATLWEPQPKQGPVDFRRGRGDE